MATEVASKIAMAITITYVVVTAQMAACRRGTWFQYVRDNCQLERLCQGLMLAKDWLS